MSGRRIRNELLAQGANLGTEHVVIAGLANDYSGYVTTPEEFAFQHYEGAHTLYGPKTFEVHLETFSELLRSLGASSGDERGSGEPLYFRPLGDFLHSSKIDGKAPWEKVGHFLREPKSSVSGGDEVSFVVRSGLPSRFQDQVEFFVLEHRRKTGWVSVPLPRFTRIEWRREKIPFCYNCSHLELRLPSANLPSGDYRVLQRGRWQPLTGKATSYQTQSRVFSLRNRL
jgi:neutral ceramidase